MNAQPADAGNPAGGAGAALVDVFDHAVPRVYGYLLARCGNRAEAQDLTSQTFLAAVDAVRRDDPLTVSVPWLVGVARHKLVDHWRRRGREERRLAALAAEDRAAEDAVVEDPWDAQLDVLSARATLARLSPHHRAALTLRYVDDLPVAEVADVLGRTVHATEALLVRARIAFRRDYTNEAPPDA